MAIFFLVLTALQILPSPILASGSTCYWQNSTLAPTSQQSIAPDDVPCFPDQENSPCCAAGWTCQSDGVCKVSQTNNGVTDEYYYRGTCTDSSWTSPQCPHFCFNINANQSWPLVKCDESSGADWYCCYGDTNCDCETGVDVLKLGTAQPYTVTVIGSTTWPGYTSTTIPFSTSDFTEIVSSASASAASSAATTSSASSNAVSSQQSSVGSSRSNTAAAAAASNTSSSGATSSSSSSSSNTGLAAGLGAGLGVALLAALGVLAYVLLRRRRNNRLAEPSPTTSSSNVMTTKPLPPYSEMQGTYGHAGDAYALNQGKYAYAHEGQYPGPGNELPGQGEHDRSEIAGDEAQAYGRQGGRAELG